MATYSREKRSTSLAWTGSFYNQNPAAGTTCGRGGQGARAQAPDNKAQTVTLAAPITLTATTLSLTAALGEMS
jgi:hypothetical protein